MARDTSGALGKRTRDEDVPVKREHEPEKPRDVEGKKCKDERYARDVLRLTLCYGCQGWAKINVMPWLLGMGKGELYAVVARDVRKLTLCYVCQGCAKISVTVWLLRMEMMNVVVARGVK